MFPIVDAETFVKFATYIYQRISPIREAGYRSVLEILCRPGPRETIRLSFQVTEVHFRRGRTKALSPIKR
ncbi:hypothetical protein BpHYR1_028249 [Brachionus plicatilis]|uniref:Uncharacterized protein n=1 Tax=Brachionus plicatilis TaxID=10195 RepID=A0A3M7R7I8_BRAPC|nr:hypothetical protein BpHYR1_028249 [Brachionus plicatilis]